MPICTNDVADIIPAMDFALSGENLLAQKTVRDFARKEVGPVIKEFDRKQESIPWVLSRMGELGILGLPFPVRYGGQGMDYVSLGLACEEVEAVDTHLRVVLSVHTGLCAMTLFQWGNEDQKRKYLVPLAKGQKIGCGAFTESGMGSDVASMRTSARAYGSTCPKRFSSTSRGKNRFSRPENVPPSARSTRCWVGRRRRRCRSGSRRRRRCW